MSGNWNGEILDMDDGKEKKNDQLNCSLVHDAEEENEKETAKASSLS